MDPIIERVGRLLMFFHNALFMVKFLVKIKSNFLRITSNVSIYNSKLK